MNTRKRRRIPLLLVGLLLAGAASAEPWIAVETGLKCSQCHANPTGGGLRTRFGNVYAQTQLSASRIGPEDLAPWTGAVGDFLAVGGNVRGNWSYTDIPHQDSSNEFETEEARFYLQAELVPGRVAVYVDERAAPGSATNLEANLRLSTSGGGYYVKVGRFYLPFGWRLEDDNAFVRRLSGVNMQTPDEGLELGMERGTWTGRLALTNGSGGGPETDDGKQVTARLEHVGRRWRIGASGLFNDSDGGERAVAGLFAGAHTGPIRWLGEVDYVDDDSLGPDGRQMAAALIEADWGFRKGHNLKLTHEWLDPDDDVDEDEQTRSSLVYEWFPFQFVELRSGVRFYDGPDQIDVQNRTEAFLQLHGYF